MTKVLKIKKGLSLNLKGKAPQTNLPPLKQGSTYAVMPSDYPGLIMPKVLVRVGDLVRVGTPLMHYKTCERLVFTSPVSGEVVAINRGAKRKVLSVEIKPDGKQEQELFEFASPDKLDAERIKEILLFSGLWTLMRQRPFDRIANPDVAPRDIFVTANFTAPLAPDIDYLLKDRLEDLRVGLELLSKLTEGKVYVNVPAGSQLRMLDAEKIKIVEVEGPHPAGLCGTLINKVKPVNKGETVWTMKATDVIVMGRFFQTKKLDFSRLVAVAGSDAREAGYVTLMPGQRIQEAFDGKLCAKDAHERIIAGDPLTGKLITDEMPFFPQGCDQITVIPEGDDVDELFGWATPGFGKFSMSRSYFSWLAGRKKEYVLDARIKGGERAIIMSHEYSKVFPLDIYPEYLIKAMIAFDIPKMEDLGIYEVAPEDFALCEFVDTSKLQLQHIVRSALGQLYKEIN